MELIKISDSQYEVYSDSGNIYQLKILSSGIKCSCLGFKHRNKCKHTSLIPEQPKKRFPRDAAIETINIIGASFTSYPWMLAGSYRRGKETIGDVDILIQATPDNLHDIAREIAILANTNVTMKGDDIVRGTVATSYGEIQFDITRVNKDEWATYLLYRTGPRDFNIKMRSEAKKHGWKLNEHGLYDGDLKLETNTEKDVFNWLGIRYLRPEER